MSFQNPAFQTSSLGRDKFKQQAILRLPLQLALPKEDRGDWAVYLNTSRKTVLYGTFRQFVRVLNPGNGGPAQHQHYPKFPAVFERRKLGKIPLTRFGFTGGVGGFY